MQVSWLVSCSEIGSSVIVPASAPALIVTFSPGRHICLPQTMPVGAELPASGLISSSSEQAWRDQHVRFGLVSRPAILKMPKTRKMRRRAISCPAFLVFSSLCIFPNLSISLQRAVRSPSIRLRNDYRHYLLLLRDHSRHQQLERPWTLALIHFDCCSRFELVQSDGAHSPAAAFLFLLSCLRFFLSLFSASASKLLSRTLNVRIIRRYTSLFLPKEKAKDRQKAKAKQNG